MDIHRCRFVPYQPQSINSIAFSHPSNPKQKSPQDLRLALGRANGDIEIWNPNSGAWTQERIFRGSFGRTIEQVQWTQDLLRTDESTEQPSFQRAAPRLFSTGGAATITEWNVETGIPKVHADSNSADVWCFAPQPQWTESQLRTSAQLASAAPSQLLAAGCADGSIVLFSTADDELRFDRVLARPHSKKSRCISIAWRDRNTIVAGFEESVIRVIDVRNKQILRTITLGKSRESSKPLVWTVKCLPNGTILSGDSTGELKIWDSQNYSLLQRIKAHNADILDIATNSAGTMILTAGVDRRTVAYAPQLSQGNARIQRWAETRHRRFHQHDVKVIASYESKTLSVAVSGGLDTIPVVVPLKNWNTEYHRSLPYLPQKPQMSISSRTRLMLTWWARDLLIWQLPPRYREPADSDSISEDQSNHQLLAQIQLQGDEYISSAQLSSDGNMVVVATSAGVKLFQLRRSISSAEIKYRAVELPRMMANNGASHVGFSPDGKWLYSVRLNNVLTMVKILRASSITEKPGLHEVVIKLDRRARSPQTSRSTLSKTKSTISVLAFSSDSRIVAVGDVSGAIDTWILEGHEVSANERVAQDKQDSEFSEADSDSDSDSDSDDETDSRGIHGQKWIKTPAGSQLPSLESAILTMSFKPSTAKPVSSGNVHGNEGLHATRHNPHPIAPEFPSASTGLLVAVTGNHQIIEFDVTNCRLSDWSRRNPSSILPERFRKIKDRTMGIWFDKRIETAVDRLWIYGASFIFMLDMSQDLAQSRAESEGALVQVGRLGKHVLEAREDHAVILASPEDEHTSVHGVGKKRKRNDGAGDAMDSRQRYTSSVRIRQDLNSDDDSDTAAGLGLPSPPSSRDEASDNEDDDMDLVEDSDAPDDKLLALRREKSTSGRAEDGTQPKDAGPQSWHTFQYRGIYGICALEPPAIGSDENGQHAISAFPEVVIVERPLYDVEMIPRFSGQLW